MKKVGIVMGSDSDFSFLEDTVKTLKKFGIPYDASVISAHRNPDKLHDWAASLLSEGYGVLIAAAGGAAHLPGVLAAQTPLPVIGVPVPNGPLNGVDALYSICQMPAGIPVATVGVGLGGAVNAAVLAAKILAVNDEDLMNKVIEYKNELKVKNDLKNDSLQEKLKNL
ncbi:MAG: 5-(carboxyamino)imidazole ribonucleotide mutase [Planctomycetota bacterium]|nr:MAG: 5-(carboxyamino)imidazole ribonucleotide mutase [Planctomycetota bacterium]